MVSSEQRAELGPKWFGQLQEEIAAAQEEGLRDFLKAVKSDAMGFSGKEGIDDDGE